jgi:eukaryotic-like serine/threonine-protein kinase
MTSAAMTMTTSQTPSSLFGYEVIGLLGEGAGSVIYAVSEPATSQLYALKHVQVQNEKDVRFIDQLSMEFEIGTKVQHPGLRRSIDLKINKTLLRKPTEAALILEMVEAVSCETHPPESIDAVIQVLFQTAQALQALHQQGYIHCDLKPNNILVDSDNKVKVIDLGQACTFGTIKKRIQGTPDFISPEQVRREPVTLQTDVYNLGATFYNILSGKKLPTLFTLKKSQNSFLVADAVPTPRQLNSRVPENLSNLIMDCCHTNPTRRPNDMGMICTRLEAIQFSLSNAGQLSISIDPADSAQPGLA